jgi:hypothetical protein
VERRPVGITDGLISLVEDSSGRCDEIIQAHHYSHKTTKNRFLSFLINDGLGAIQLGYGIRPKMKHTISTEITADNFCEFGWVYLDGTGRDGYSESVEDFWENWENDADESAEKPKYVWACQENHFAVADVSDITERIADNGYEDFDSETLDGLDELKAAIEKFNEANKDVVSYEPDYGIAILLNAEPCNGRELKKT